MDTFRPLRAVFDDLAGSQDRDVAELLRDAGHGDLPEVLLADALTSYADTASVEVAEQLAPFVTAHTSGFGEDVAEGLELLAGAAVADLDVDQLSGDTVDAVDSADSAAEAPGESADLDIDFGVGSAVEDLDLDTVDDSEGHFGDEVPLEPADHGHFGDEVPEPGLPESFGEGAGVAEPPDFDDLGEG